MELLGREDVDKSLQQNNEDMLTESDTGTECTRTIDNDELDNTDVNLAENTRGMLTYDFNFHARYTGVY